MKEKNKVLIGGGILTDGDTVFFEEGAIHIENGKILKVDRLSNFTKKDFDYIDVGGRIIIPGLLNAHHHLYSFLAVGLYPIGETNSFIEILKNLWWRLDKILNEEEVYYSSLLGLMDSVKHGVTMIFDHHASMNFVNGSLNKIEKAFDKIKIKGLLCFETSNRIKDFKKHVEENICFFKKNINSPSVHGVMGLHANMTIDDAILKYIKSTKPDSMPVHIHIGEDSADLNFCRNLNYKGPVQRMHEFDLIDARSILVHAIHLTGDDYCIIDKIKPVIVSNPESNANNRVGKMNRDKIKSYVLGTDGMSSDMISTLRSQLLLGEGYKEDFQRLHRVFFQNRFDVQEKYFPCTGRFTEGNVADICVLDYVPITPVSIQNLTPHLIFGSKNARAYMTISNGNIIYKEGKFCNIDENEVIREAKKVARKLHDKYFN